MSLLGTSWHGRVFSNDWSEAEGGDAVVLAPATGEEIGRIGVAAPSDVARAAEIAAAAQEKWAPTPYTERAGVLRRAGLLWEQHAAEIGHWLVRETGSILPKAGVETDTAAQECYEAAALALHSLGEIIPSAQPRLSLARRLPVGVEEAGLPDGVLHVLPGGVDAGEALVTDERVPVISFTGSTTAGRRVGELAARYLKRAHLELGGNSARSSTRSSGTRSTRW